MAPTSKLTTRGRTTLPREVREELGLRPGDRIAYQVEGDSALMHKLGSMDRANLRGLQATLSEWDSPEDAEAYDDL